MRSGLPSFSSFTANFSEAVGLDIREAIVVIDRRHIERRFVVEGVVELQCLSWIVEVELLDGSGCMNLDETRGCNF